MRMLSLPSRPALKKKRPHFLRTGRNRGAYNVSGFGLPVFRLGYDELNALRGARVAVHSKRVAESQ